MNIKHDKQPSDKSQAMLESLRNSVAAALERKRQLGQYAVVWDGEKTVKQHPGQTKKQD